MIVLSPTIAAGFAGSTAEIRPGPLLGLDMRGIIVDVAFLRRLLGVRRIAPTTSSAHAISTETDALIRAAAGDQRAFAQFYDLVSPMVFGLIVKIVRSPSISEEVAQEVFVELWRNAPAFSAERGSARAWAATIARRRAIDRVRSEESARRRDDNEAAFGARAVSGDSVGEQVELDIEHQGVAQALTLLSERQREAITLAFYGGHSYREVADLLETPEGTIKTRIRDGLSRLREILEVA